MEPTDVDEAQVGPSHYWGWDSVRLVVVSMPIALGIWSFQGPGAAAMFVAIITLIAIAVGLAGRRSRALQIGIVVAVIAVAAVLAFAIAR